MIILVAMLITRMVVPIQPAFMDGITRSSDRHDLAQFAADSIVPRVYHDGNDAQRHSATCAISPMRIRASGATTLTFDRPAPLILHLMQNWTTIIAGLQAASSTLWHYPHSQYPVEHLIRLHRQQSRQRPKSRLCDGSARVAGTAFNSIDAPPR